MARQRIPNRRYYRHGYAALKTAWRKTLFLKHSGFTFLSVIARGLSFVLINKFFAIYFGASGLALLAHFRNFLSLPLLLAGEGSYKALLRYWSLAQYLPTQKKAAFWVSTAFWLSNIILLFFLGFCAVFADFFWKEFQLLFDSFSWFWLLLLFVHIWQLLFVSLLLAMQKIKAYSIAISVAGWAALLALYTLKDHLSQADALLVYGTGQGVALLCSLYLLRETKLTFCFFKPEVLRLMIPFLLTASAIVLLNKLTDFALRREAILMFGEELTGFWQAILQVSEGYTMIFSATFMSLFFPQVSARITQPLALQNYLKKVIPLILISSLIGLGIVYGFRQMLTRALYSEDFVAYADWFLWILPADLSKFGIFIIGNLLLAATQMKRFMILQLIYALIYIGAAYWLTASNGIVGFLQAKLLASCLTILPALYYLRTFLK
ncbi:MAG: hypothetical protein JJT94_00960 [Bernardetiaceae bacterium]|nr:hypothetical protein [Bernardetiaceae bacterium]